jgi:hypothetical protein
MREIRNHVVNPTNDKLTITVTDEPGQGGANHRYEIAGFDASVNPSAFSDDPRNRAQIVFQNGPISEVGVNGVTHEALIAILIDRLTGFQDGKFACIANEQALRHLTIAQNWLLQRTRERMARNVEGTHQE